MPARLRNERLFCLAVFIGVTIGSSPVIIMLLPVAWLAFWPAFVWR